MEYTVKDWIERAEEPDVHTMMYAACPGCWRPLPFEFDVLGSDHCQCEMQVRVSIEEVLEAHGLLKEGLGFEWEQDFNPHDPKQRND